MPSIEVEIQQPKFKSPSQRAQINIIYTSAWINQRTTAALRPLKMSIQQFNILRILRGRAGEPATIKMLTERMLDKMSNASRLVDKLKEKGYVERQECPTDRRRVDIVITDLGLEMVGKATKAIERKMDECTNNLDEEQYTLLSDLLDQMRG